MQPIAQNSSEPRACRARISAVLLLACAAMAGGCSAEDEGNAFCGAAPATAIVSFAVTTTTGDNGTNADIRFCYTSKSSGGERCELLDELSEDDFEAGEVQEYVIAVSPPIAAGDLDHFTIRNSGNGFLDNDWGMESLLVEAAGEDGEVYVLYEEQMSAHLEEGDSYSSRQCEY